MSARLDELALAWGAWAGPLALQLTLLGAALLVVDRFLLRRAWPRLRLALHGVVLLGLVLPPLPLLPGAPSLWPRLLASAATEPGGVATDLAANVAPRPSLLLFAFAAWLVVALLLAAGVLIRHARVRARLRALDLGASAPLRAQVAAVARRLRLRRVPDVVVLAGAASPAVLGCWRPLVLLPAALAARVEDLELEHALLHELLHVKRGDLLAALFARLVAIAWWFHPLAWIVARRATALRELACDDDVARLLRERAPAYRATLLERARQLVAEPQLRDAPASSIALGFFAAPSTLLARLEWLARPRRSRPRLERGVTWLVAALLALATWPAAAAARDRGAAPQLATGPGGDLRDAALAVVKRASGPERTPGCLQLQYAVAYLLANSPEKETP